MTTQPDPTEQTGSTPAKPVDFFVALDAELERLMLQIAVIGMYSPQVASSLQASFNAVLNLLETYFNWAAPLLATLPEKEEVVMVGMTRGAIDGLNAQSN